MKIGIVFDNRPRPETTGYYCRRALGRLADVEHLLPEELGDVPTGLFDLFLLIDDGLDYPIPDRLRPRAAWAIDTHVDFARARERFGNADYVFAAQKNGAAHLAATSGQHVTWLPLACDPIVHRPLPGSSVVNDVAFVGNRIGRRRNELMDLLERRFPNSLFCQAIFDGMAKAYSSSKVGFNCSIADDLNMRLFEIPAHQIPLVTNRIAGNGFEELFTIGKHVLAYECGDELLEQVETFLRNDKLRQSIAESGYQHVLANHTYDHRMRSLLAAVSARTQKAAVYVSGLSKADTALPPKNEDYFDFSRPDVQALIPATAFSILDVGCGAGRLGEDLKRARACHVTGVEPRSGAASRARGRLDAVIEKPVESVEEADLRGHRFDCIVFADVLEHLRSPASILEKARAWLKPDGCIVISVPNSRHHSVVSGLIDGNWTYERSGLLDEDHVRCFTRRELEKLLFRCGFDIQTYSPIPGSGYEAWEESGRPGKVSIGRLRIEGLSEPDAEEFFVYQHLVRAVPRATRQFGLTSIVAVTWNQLAFTKECVESILSRTDEPVELIFVDNGSSDGTPDFLQNIPGAKVILNAENRGFAPAVNQGLQVCSGDQIVLLNNDCVVSTGWLSQLLTVLQDNERNGLVGPVSNNVSGEQQVEVNYFDLASMDGFAWDLRKRRDLIVTDRLVGFCLMFRREVLDQIGLLDEQFEVGCFEDDDFCRRAIAAGFRAVIATNAFVHHYGSATFRASGFDFSEIMARNQERFDKKWADQIEPDKPAPPARKPEPTEKAKYQLVHVAGDTGRLSRSEVKLSLCMIVRDNEDTIGACLESIYPWVDEIIVVDTGSKDKTPEICQSYGARLSEFPWCDDFSAARNESLRYATGEWIFWMDSDDVILQDQGRKLRHLAYGVHPEEVHGYVMQVQCPGATAAEMTVVDHVKIFRKLGSLRFEHRIHEQILPAIRRSGGQVAFTDIYVVHSGARQTPEVRARKLERDFRLLKLDSERFPDHPFVLFNLGMTYEDAGDYVEAERCLQRSIEVAVDGESHLRKAWALLTNCQREQGRTQEAIESSTKALTLFPGDKELLFRRAMLYQDIGKLDLAIADYNGVLSGPSDKVFQSIDPGIAGHKAHHNIALALKESGQIDEAISHWRKAAELCATFSQAWESLGRILIQHGDLPGLHAVLDDMPVCEELAATRSILTALVRETHGDLESAQSILERAWSTTGDTICLDELCRLLSQQAKYELALPKLQALHSQRPDDPAVMHNLGITLHLCGHTDAGKQVLQKCVSAAPSRLNTICQLASIHEHENDLDAAIKLLTDAKSLEIEAPELTQMLERLYANR